DPVIHAERRAAHRYTVVRGHEWRRRALLIHADDLRDRSRQAVYTDDRQHGADAVSGAVWPSAVDAFEVADRKASSADLCQQRRRAGVALHRRIRKCVNDAFGSEVRRTRRRRVVAVARIGWTALEVLRDRVAFGVSE